MRCLFLFLFCGVSAAGQVKYVSDKNDKAYKAYKDSLYDYNEFLRRFDKNNIKLLMETKTTFQYKRIRDSLFGDVDNMEIERRKEDSIYRKINKKEPPERKWVFILRKTVIQSNCGCNYVQYELWTEEFIKPKLKVVYVKPKPKKVVVPVKDTVITKRFKVEHWHIRYNGVTTLDSFEDYKKQQ